MSYEVLEIPAKEEKIRSLLKDENPQTDLENRREESNLHLPLYGSTFTVALNLWSHLHAHDSLSESVLGV
jgi:hypothetical protein